MKINKVLAVLGMALFTFAGCSNSQQMATPISPLSLTNHHGPVRTEDCTVINQSCIDPGPPPPQPTIGPSQDWQIGWYPAVGPLPGNPDPNNFWQPWGNGKPIAIGAWVAKNCAPSSGGGTAPQINDTGNGKSIAGAAGHANATQSVDRVFGTTTNGSSVTIQLGWKVNTYGAGSYFWSVPLTATLGGTVGIATGSIGATGEEIIPWNGNIVSMINAAASAASNLGPVSTLLPPLNSVGEMTISIAPCGNNQ